MNSESFESAFRFLMKHEGTRYTDDPDDPGGATKFGITLAAARDEGLLDVDEDGDIDARDIAALTIEQAAEYVYRAWWIPLRLDKIEHVAVARKVLDICFNVGPVTGIKILQHALNKEGATLKEDGKIGLKTLAAIERANAVHLVDRLRQLQRERYQSLVHRNPRLKKFLKGWLNRAAA